ncbi:hypothetical protein VIC_003056 [Vibrio coralliilyticus ATCC BAA-450]|nr:hypothetical protein VIC_003056 [Vibrio coralliilyticus ATCC BAA-450]
MNVTPFYAIWRTLESSNRHDMVLHLTDNALLPIDLENP